MTSLRRLAASRAETQYGVLSFDQLREIGVSPGFIDRRLASGEWTRLGSRVVAVSGAPDGPLRRCAAALVSRPHAFLSGRTAAWLHGFDGVAEPKLPEITVPFTASGRSALAKVRRSQHHSTIATAMVESLRVADGAETVFRMAAYVGARRLGRMIDSLLIADAAVSEQLGEIYLRHQGERMRGMARLRPILLERLGARHVPTESELEALAEDVLSTVPFPSVVRQAPLPWAPSRRADLLIPEWRLIVELDGRAWHARTEAFEADRQRDNAAVGHGYSTVRLTWRMLSEEPGRCRQLLADIGRRRTSRPTGLAESA